MNGIRNTIKSLYVAHETGIVWQAVFPYPNDSFLADMDWTVLDAGNRTLEFEAYSFRKLVEEGSPTLHIRFRDRGWTRVSPEGRLSAELHSPSS
jgi:hypothetical protein